MFTLGYVNRPQSAAPRDQLALASVGVRRSSGKGWSSVWQDWDTFRAQQAATRTIGGLLLSFVVQAGNGVGCLFLKSHNVPTIHGSRFFRCHAKTKAQTNINTNEYFFIDCLSFCVKSPSLFLCVPGSGSAFIPEGILLYRGSRPKKGPSEC